MSPPGISLASFWETAASTALHVAATSIKTKQPKATRNKKKYKKKRTHCVPLSTATRILCDEIYA